VSGEGVDKGVVALLTRVPTGAPSGATWAPPRVAVGIESCFTGTVSVLLRVLRRPAVACACAWMRP